MSGASTYCGLEASAHSELLEEDVAKRTIGVLAGVNQDVFASGRVPSTVTVRPPPVPEVGCGAVAASAEDGGILNHQPVAA